jgi:hypothetical protein
MKMYLMLLSDIYMWDLRMTKNLPQELFLSLHTLKATGSEWKQPNQKRQVL